MLVCTAILGKQNELLFIHPYGEANPLKYHFVLHGVIGSIPDLTKNPPPESYLGFLGQLASYRVYLFLIVKEVLHFINISLTIFNYGYITNTNNKFLVVTDSVSVNHEAMNSFLAEFHRLYIIVSCNPFLRIKEPFVSKQLSLDLDELRSRLNQSICS